MIEETGFIINSPSLSQTNANKPHTVNFLLLGSTILIAN